MSRPHHPHRFVHATPYLGVRKKVEKGDTSSTLRPSEQDHGHGNDAHLDPIGDEWLSVDKTVAASIRYGGWLPCRDAPRRPSLTMALPPIISVIVDGLTLMCTLIVYYPEITRPALRRAARQFAQSHSWAGCVPTTFPGFEPLDSVLDAPKCRVCRLDCLRYTGWSRGWMFRRCSLGSRPQRPGKQPSLAAVTHVYRNDQKLAQAHDRCVHLPYPWQGRERRNILLLASMYLAPWEAACVGILTGRDRSIPGAESEKAHRWMLMERRGQIWCADSRGDGTRSHLIAVDHPSPSARG